MPGSVRCAPLGAVLPNDMSPTRKLSRSGTNAGMTIASECRPRHVLLVVKSILPSVAPPETNIGGEVSPEGTPPAGILVLVPLPALLLQFACLPKRSNQ